MKIKDVPLGAVIDTNDKLWVKVNNRRNSGFLLIQSLDKTFSVPNPNGKNRDERNFGTNLFPRSELFKWLNGKLSEEEAQNYQYPYRSADRLKSKQQFPDMLRAYERKAIVPHEAYGETPQGYIREYGNEWKVSALVSIPKENNFNVDSNECYDLIRRDGLRAIGKAFGYTCSFMIFDADLSGKNVKYVVLSDRGDEYSVVSEQASFGHFVHPYVEVDDEFEFDADVLSKYGLETYYSNFLPKCDFGIF